MFSLQNKKGEQIRHRVGLDCSKDVILVEQAHKKDVDINSIIKKHGMELIQKTAQLQQSEYQFDDVTGNDFQEAMNITLKAQKTFESLPSKIRKEFDHNPAQFLDFVQNPDNTKRMVELGLAENRPVEPPIEVHVTNAPTPDTEAPPA